MKRSFKPGLILAAGLFFVLANVVNAQAPTTPTATPPATPNTGGSGGILEPPGGGVLDGAYTPEHLVYRKPIPYVYEREADIMWQRRIWRVIDLREKINHPLYYPEDSLAKRPSLWQVLKNGVREGKITTVFEFDIFTNEFGKPLTQPEF